MALYQNYPYTDLQTANLDYLLLQTKTNTESIQTTNNRVTANANAISANASAISTEAATRDHSDRVLQDQINGIIAGTAQVADRRLNVNYKRRVLFLADNFANIDSVEYCALAARYLGLPTAYYQVIYRQGAGFHPASYAASRTFANMLSGATLEIDSDKITDVVFTAGAYDVSAATADIADGINTCCDWVKNNIPNARIWILLAAWRPDKHESNDFINVYNTYRLYAAANGATFDYSGIAIHSTALLDNTRMTPTAAGCRNLAFATAQILCGSESSLIELRRQAVTFTPSAPLSSTTSEFIDNRLYGGTVFVGINGRLNFDNTTNVQLTVWIDIGTVTSAMFAMSTTNPQQIVVPCVINYTGGAHAAGTAAFRIVGNVLQCNLRAVNLSTGGWYAAQPVSTVQLYGAGAALDAIYN